jgi:molybdopterin-guanine dinucleotide biosynthesis protein A
VIVPVDMPKLKPELLRLLLHSMGEADAAIFEAHPLPFVCRASSRLIQIVHSLCEPGVPSRQRSFRELARQMNAKEIPIPTESLPFLENFNTPEDLIKISA